MHVAKSRFWAENTVGDLHSLNVRWLRFSFATLMSSESTISYWLWMFRSSVSCFSLAVSWKRSMSTSPDSAPSCN